MRLEGRLFRDGKWWLVEVPLLHSMTQGRTRSEALEMAVDLVETLVGRPGFAAKVHPGPGDGFELSASEVAPLIALVLRQSRARSGLSLAEVAGRLGSSSRNAYARYEQGRTVPTVAKLAELLAAVDCGVVLRAYPVAREEAPVPPLG